MKADWMPTIIKQVMSMDIGVVGWLSAVPNVAAFCGILLFGKLCDKTQNRKKFCIIPYTGVGVCMALSVVTAPLSPWLSFAFLCGCGFFWMGGHSPMWAMVPSLFSQEVSGGVRGIINALGNLSGFFSPMLLGYMTREYNRDYGLYFLSVLLFGAAFIARTMPKITEGKK